MEHSDFVFFKFYTMKPKTYKKFKLRNILLQHILSIYSK